MNDTGEECVFVPFHHTKIKKQKVNVISCFVRCLYGKPGLDIVYMRLADIFCLVSQYLYTKLALISVLNKLKYIQNNITFCRPKLPAFPQTCKFLKKQKQKKVLT